MSLQKEFNEQLAILDNLRLQGLRERGKASENLHHHIPTLDPDSGEILTLEIQMSGQARDSKWKLQREAKAIGKNMSFYKDQYGNTKTEILHYEGIPEAREQIEQLRQQKQGVNQE